MMTMRRAIAITVMVLALMGAKLSCQTSTGLPVHTRAHWLQVLIPTGQPVIILRPGVKPPPIMIHGKTIPGTWQHRGNTYIGDHVWTWHPGHPNGQAN
jgi:hypothetical protein